MTRNREDGVYLRNRIIILIWLENSENLGVRRMSKYLQRSIIRHSKIIKDTLFKISERFKTPVTFIYVRLFCQGPTWQRLFTFLARLVNYRRVWLI